MVLALHKSTFGTVIETGEVIYITITDHSKTAGSVAHRHTIICAHRIQQNMLNTLPPNAPQPERTNPIDDRGTYIQLRGAYTHLTQSDQHHSTISPDSQWYHTAHLPISTPETKCTLVDQNPRAYTMRISQLPIEHRPFLYHPLAP